MISEISKIEKMLGTDDWAQFLTDHRMVFLTRKAWGYVKKIEDMECFYCCELIGIDHSAHGDCIQKMYARHNGK